MAKTQDMAGIFALILVVLLLIANGMREKPLSRADVKDIATQALANASAQTIKAVVDKFHSCSPVQIPPEARNRNCDQMCGDGTCLLAGVRFHEGNDSTYQPVTCGLSTTERLFCYCCG